MAKQFYAAYRPYGITALNTAGPRGDELLGFPNRAERDAWIARDREHREAVSATANEVRSALRFEARNGYRIVRTAGEFAADR
jgi:hypothetical protein